MEDNFTFYQKPELKENFEPVPEGDFLPQNPGTDFYLIVADPSGKVAWQDGVLDDFYGHQKAQVVELVTEKACRSEWYNIMEYHKTKRRSHHGTDFRQTVSIYVQNSRYAP